MGFFRPEHGRQRGRGCEVFLRPGCGLSSACPVGACAYGGAVPPRRCRGLEEGCPVGAYAYGGFAGIPVPCRWIPRVGAGPAHWVHLYVVPAFHVDGPFRTHRRCISLASPRQRRGKPRPLTGKPCRGVPDRPNVGSTRPVDPQFLCGPTSKINRGTDPEDPGVRKCRRAPGAVDVLEVRLDAQVWFERE